MTNNDMTKLREPETDKLMIVLPGPPVRSKAARQKKDQITNAIRAVTSQRDYILTGEIGVDIEWMIHEQQRYESHRSPDLDNILKVALDALQGPQGIMVNDCQVQSISCRWIDWNIRDQQLTIRISHNPDDYCPRKALLFVRVWGSLCMPINSDLPPAGLLFMMDYWKRVFTMREKLLDDGWDYYAANRIVPNQRAFHSSKTRGFPLKSLSEFESETRGTTG